MPHSLKPPASFASRPAGPLRGLGILVTRPARQASGFAEKIVALGGQPIIFPAIAILPPSDPVPVAQAHARLGDYDYAIFVSASAVEYGVPDPRHWPEELVAFAPGPGTADALASVGVGAVRIPTTTFDSDGLLDLPELVAPSGKRIVIFRGEGGREQLGDALAARGAQVDYVACYRRAKPESDATGLNEAFRDGRVAAVTITSSEGLDNLWALGDVAMRAAWRRVPTFVPHPRIATHARALGLDVVETAGSDAGLLAGLLKWAAAQPLPKT